MPGSNRCLQQHAPAYLAKLADQLRSCGLYDQVPADAWAKTFVVDIEPVGDGRAVLKYLAPYVHRVAISDSRIVACDQTSVTFRYKPSGPRLIGNATYLEPSSSVDSCSTRCHQGSKRSATTAG